MTALAMTLKVDLFTEQDFIAAFNEWERRTQEAPERMTTWMDQCLKGNNDNVGKACTALLFSILHDLKRKEGHE